MGKYIYMVNFLKWNCLIKQGTFKILIYMAKFSSKKVVLVYTLATRILDHFLLQTLSDPEYQWFFVHYICLLPLETY